MSLGLCASFAATLAEQARLRPDGAALVVPAGRDPGAAWRTRSFAELNAEANRFAHGFARRGVRAGDRVLLLLKPSFELYAVLYGLLRLGAVPVFMDPGMGLRRLLRCIGRLRPRVVVAVPPVHAVRTVARGAFAGSELFVTAGRRWFWGGLALDGCRAAGDEPFPDEPADEDGCALLVFTSGSTGPPKGVRFTRRMMHTQARLLGDAYGWRPGDRMVMCFAAFALFSLAHGMTTILPDMDMPKPARARPDRIVDAVRANRAGHAFASPVIWANVARHCARENGRLEGLRQLLTTGAPIPLDLHLRLRAILPDGAELHTPYGATEALPIATIATREVLAETAAASRAGEGICVGRPFPGVELALVRVSDDPLPEWSDDFCVGAGEIGEVVVGGDMVSPGYESEPAADAAARIRRGSRLLHRMGDLGRVDDEGRLWFCGRKSHRVETAHGMIPPVPVETVFNEHPKVWRTALVGVGPRGAQAPVLCVQMEAGESFDGAVREELERLAAGTKWGGLVAHFLPHPGFPVDPRHNSKIVREELARWATRQLGGETRGGAA